MSQSLVLKNSELYETLSKSNCTTNKCTKSMHIWPKTSNIRCTLPSNYLKADQSLVSFW